MTASDWSVRYLSLALLSTSATIVTWLFASALVLFVAVVTIVAFVTLSLVHAYRLRARPQPPKIDRIP